MVRLSTPPQREPAPMESLAHERRLHPMSTPLPKTSLAARMGRWSARHRKAAIFGWLAFVIVAVLIGGSMGTKTLGDGDDGAGSSGRADKILAQEFPQPATERVLVQGSGAEANAAVHDVIKRVSAVPAVKNVRSPFDHPSQISHDGRSRLVLLGIKGSSDDAQDRVAPVTAAVDQAQKAHPGVRVAQFGDASAGKAMDERIGKDFQKAESLSLPITLAILILTFGALVAAGLPLLLGLTSVAATIGLTAIISQITPMDPAITSVILLIGMAVGVDYALFYMRREREERAAGASPEEALDTAAATSGRAVLISGLTVMTAMAGMFFTGSKTFSSFAIGTIIVVGVAMIGSMTVLPALLSKLGDNVNKGRVPFLHREAASESRIWGWIVDRVMKRPLLTGGLAATLLIAMAIPAFSLHTADPGAQGLPRDMPIVKTYNRIQKAFPGGPLPAQV